MSIDVYPPKGLLVPGTELRTIGLPFSCENSSGTIIDNSAMLDAISTTAITSWRIPPDYAGGAITFTWARRAIATGGTIRFQYYTYLGRNGIALAAVHNGIIADFTPTDTNVQFFSFQDITTGQIGDFILLQYMRIGADANDTSTTAVSLSGVSVTYLANTPRVFNAQPYDEGSFIVTATGFSGTAPSGTARYVRIGKQITLTLPDISGTSNAVNFTITGVLTALYPRTSYRFMVQVQDNGAYQMGLCLFDVAGTFTLYSHAGFGGWIASGVKTLFTPVIAYHIV